ncbi:class I SAM-dependent methyltransferase [Halorarius litoreus]|uniref:class I SAM-dependent methyltransferase n=1 Tax=Halorarius litoreus TaxID=2962676 RepID=UPI0020CCF2D9|nr:class I SAM-dependent methyltransferase family protein [Halorarius litoreus]
MPEGLAVVVDMQATQAAIDALETEGVYDPSRSVEPFEEGIAIPVTARPETVEGRVVETDLPARNRDLRDLLAARGWDDADLEQVPSSWAVLGSCIVVDDTGFPDQSAVGDALLDLHGNADTVLLHRGISGRQREPDVEVIAGVGDTEVVHTEHGTKYAMDLSRVMFSPGNQAERARMGEVVDADERVFDMFAGIGYFTLPMARAGAAVTAAEINPEAYRYLVENAVLNGVQERVSAFRADCRDVDATADRVVMGYYESYQFLDAALDALVSGGTLHLHETTPDPELWDRPVGRIETAAADHGRTAEILDRRVVKTHAPGVKHVVVDARVD